MIGWNYPRNKNLHNLIEEMDLIPLTALTTITQNEKKLFLANGIVLAKQLNNFELLKSYGLADLKIKLILKEVEDICLECSKSIKNESIL